MSATLFRLVADYETAKSELFSSDPAVLRLFARDHYRAATIKPAFTLLTPDGQLLASMDYWSGQWVEEDTDQATGA
ncbi:MAG: hypothetical protein HWE26_22465 [Alteromonadaceae bacterium]|nr:hypothetical protein [Alteromonadaceae bacterium]